MIRRFALAGIAMAVTAVVSAAHAQDLVNIGSASLDLSKAGSTTIDVSNAKGAFRGVRVKSTDGKLTEISRIEVIYASGPKHTESRNIKLKRGERTKPVNETSDDRFIDKVEVTWSATKGKGAVQVLGLQTRDGANKARAAKPASGDLSAGTIKPDAKPATPGSIVDGNDVLFGYQNVGFAIDRDVVKVGGDVGKFARIRLRVLGNEVHLNTLKINYVDGGSQDLAVDADIKANTRSKWLEIEPTKFIRDIQLSYRSKAANLSKGQARIEVTGQYADGWLGPNGEGKKYNQGWVLLGAQTAGFAGFDNDTITVGKNEGGFSKLRIVAKERAITLREVRIVHSTGPDEVFQMRERIDPDKPYGPLEFKGGRTAIKEIQARYRSRFDITKGLKSLLQGNPAVVEIWGQH